MSSAPTTAPAASPYTRWVPAFQYWLTNYKRSWRGTVISGLIGPVFFLLAMGFGLGALVDRSPGGVDGMGYLTFVAPGILAAQAMQTAVSESTFPVMGGHKWFRIYFAMTATPLESRDVLLGHLAFVAMRVTMTSVAFALVAVVFGAMSVVWVVAGVIAAVLTGLAFVTPVFTYSIRQDSESGFNVLFRFIVMPMFLFAGVFFPIDRLPTVLEWVAMATPLWHGVDLTRGLVLETISAPVALGHVGYLLAWIVGGFVAASFAFRKRLVS